MGAVSTRGARRDRRLAKCNSPLYGPMKASIPAVVRLPATGGSSRLHPPRHGQVHIAAGQFRTTRWAERELFSAALWTCPGMPPPEPPGGFRVPKGGAAARQILLQKHPSVDPQCYGLPVACQPAPDQLLRASPQVSAGFVAGNPAPNHAWKAVCCSGRCQARRVPSENSSSPFRTVRRQRGSVPVSKAGSSGVLARGSVLQDWTLPSATWTMSSSTSQTANVAGAPGTNCPAIGLGYLAARQPARV